jgi:hypothetical protein
MSQAGHILRLGGVAAMFLAAALPAQDGSSRTELDAMDETRGWTVYKDDRGVTVSLGTEEWKNGKAVEVYYSMEGGEWLGIYKAMNRDFSGFKGVRFLYHGVGSRNTFEFKLEDQDGTQFGKVIGPSVTTADWVEVVIPFDQMEYWWDGDSQLDWKNIRNVHFAVSKKNAKDQAGSGKLMIDRVELFR